MERMKQQRREHRLQSRLVTPDDKINLETEIAEGQNMTKMRKRRSRLQTEIVTTQQGKHTIHEQRTVGRQRRINSTNFTKTFLQNVRNRLVVHSLQDAIQITREEQAALAEDVNVREMNNRQSQLDIYLAEQDLLQKRKWEEMRRNFADGDR